MTMPATAPPERPLGGSAGGDVTVLRMSSLFADAAVRARKGREIPSATDALAIKADAEAGVDPSAAVAEAAAASPSDLLRTSTQRLRMEEPPPTLTP